MPMFDGKEKKELHIEGEGLKQRKNIILCDLVVVLHYLSYLTCAFTFVFVPSHTHLQLRNMPFLTWHLNGCQSECSSRMLAHSVASVFCEWSLTSWV